STWLPSKCRASVQAALASQSECTALAGVRWCLPARSSTTQAPILMFAANLEADAGTLEWSRFQFHATDCTSTDKTSTDVAMSGGGTDNNSRKGKRKRIED